LFLFCNNLIADKPMQIEHRAPLNNRNVESLRFIIWAVVQTLDGLATPSGISCRVFTGWVVPRKIRLAPGRIANWQRIAPGNSPPTVKASLIRSIVIMPGTGDFVKAIAIPVPEPASILINSPSRWMK
jgi:hypothetical protein